MRRSFGMFIVITLLVSYLLTSPSVSYAAISRDTTSAIPTASVASSVSTFVEEFASAFYCLFNNCKKSTPPTVTKVYVPTYITPPPPPPPVVITSPPQTTTIVRTSPSTYNSYPTYYAPPYPPTPTLPSTGYVTSAQLQAQVTALYDFIRRQAEQTGSDANQNIQSGGASTGLAGGTVVGSTITGSPISGSTGSFTTLTSTSDSSFATGSGNVGIGTTAPGQKLSVVGTIESTTGGFKFPDGTTMTTAGVGSANSLSNITDVIMTGDSDANGSGNVILRTGISDRLTILNNGNVGIGTTSPSTLLSVSGASGFMLTNTGAGNTLYIEDVANDTSPFVITGNGNVGIGTSSPNSKLEINVNYGKFTVTPIGLNSWPFQIFDATAPANDTTGGGLLLSGWRDAAQTTKTGLGAIDAVQEVVGTEGGSLRMFTNDGTGAIVERFRINKSGNVGIGTTSPQGRLDVSGSSASTVLTTFDGTRAISLVNTNTTNNNANGFDFRTMDTNGLITTGSKLMSVYTSHAANTVSADMAFLTRDAGTITEKMRLTSVGNFGIGSTSPIAKLSVIGDTYITGGLALGTSTTNTAAATIQILKSGAGPGSTIVSVGTDVIGSVFLLRSPGAFGAATYSANSGNAVVNIGAATSGNQSVSLSARGGATFADGVGSVGIGTTTPSARLAITQSANNSTGGLWIAETGNTDFRSLFMDTAGTLSFFGGNTAGTLNTATLSDVGAWINASDRIYKENIADLNTKYSLSDLMKLEPRFYTMKGTGKPQIGFIAQEVKAVIPEVVEGEEGSMGISYGNLVAMAIQGVKELSVKLDKIISDIKEMFGQKIETKELCLDGLCISKTELQQILQSVNSTTTASSSPATDTASPPPFPPPQNSVPPISSTPTPPDTSSSTPVTSPATENPEPAVTPAPSATPEVSPVIPPPPSDESVPAESSPAEAPVQASSESATP